MKRNLDQKIWREILQQISNNVTEVSYNTWFAPLTPLSIDEEAGVLYFATDNNQVLKVLEMRYIPNFEQCAEQVLGKPYKVVVNVMTTKEISTSVESVKAQVSKTVAPVAKTPTDPTNTISNLGNPTSTSNKEFREEYFLNPTYNFDNFIVGPNNKYAHAVSVAVAESPGKVYNPLYIHGGSGLGKTHLMHAIGHYILENDTTSKVLYVSSEMFTQELVNAIRDTKNRNKLLDLFQQKYRNADVLLIDDIQFLEGKESTQLEFFHTFNKLYDSGKQIVISSDRHPSKLTELDDRLRSRFQWNVIADIQPPDFETRVAILRSKAELEQIEIDDDMLDVINLIAEKVKFNIRELESALTRINSYSKLFNKHINARFAIDNLSDIFTASDYDISCETIKKAVCKHWGIKISEIESKNRKREYTYPRQVAMYLCSEMTNLSTKQIGKYFGGRDHTTVLHAIKKIKADIDSSEEIAKDINRLRNDIY